MNVNEFNQLLSNRTNLQVFTVQELIAGAEAVAGQYLRRTSTHQMRRFFAPVKKLQEKSRVQSNFEQRDMVPLYMLKPQLANRAKKDRDFEDFYLLMSKIIDKTHTKEDFENFAAFFESLVAFHNER